MNDPRMMKMIRDLMMKSKGAGDSSVVKESDIGEGMAVESPDQEYETPDDISRMAEQLGQSSEALTSGAQGKSYETSPEIEALLAQLQGNQASPAAAQVAPESIDMKKAALEKVKQRMLGR